MVAQRQNKVFPAKITERDESFLGSRKDSSQGTRLRAF